MTHHHDVGIARAFVALALIDFDLGVLLDIQQGLAGRLASARRPCEAPIRQTRVLHSRPCRFEPSRRQPLPLSSPCRRPDNSSLFPLVVVWRKTLATSRAQQTGCASVPTPSDPATCSRSAPLKPSVYGDWSRHPSVTVRGIERAWMVIVCRRRSEFADLCHHS